MAYERELEHLRKGETPVFRPLSFYSNSDVDALVDAIRESPNLREFSLQHDNLSMESVKAIIAALGEKPYLTVVNLREMDIEIQTPHMMPDDYEQNSKETQIKVLLEDAMLENGNPNLAQCSPQSGTTKAYCFENIAAACILRDRMREGINTLNIGEIQQIQARLPIISRQFATGTGISRQEMDDVFSRFDQLLLNTLPIMTPSLANRPEDLLEPKPNGFAPLDNPLTWEFLPEICARLEKQGSPFTVEQLMAPNKEGKSFLQTRLEAVPPVAVLATLEKCGLPLRGDVLLDGDKPSPLFRHLILEHSTALLFKENNWHGATPEELKAVIRALPADQKPANRHTLLAGLSRQQNTAQPAAIGQ